MEVLFVCFFQGNLSPLLCHSMLETCVLPILLCLSENWILTEGLMANLETFQARVDEKNPEVAQTLLQHGSTHSIGGTNIEV